jgi:hypothetical protein
MRLPFRMSINNNIEEPDMAKMTDSSSTRVNAKPDSASRAERDATQRHVMGGGSARNFSSMRKAQDANTTFHREAVETRKSRK